MLYFRIIGNIIKGTRYVRKMFLMKYITNVLTGGFDIPVIDRDISTAGCEQAGNQRKQGGFADGIAVETNWIVRPLYRMVRVP
jgi:hypothetical protein